jgi:cyclophilin family peptidyl-prolyl cis-trans isomerase
MFGMRHLYSTTTSVAKKHAHLPRIFLDIAINGVPAGRMIFQLRSDVVPRTVENFRQLCTGECGFGLRGSHMHRIVSGFMAQGGDFTNGTGVGGRSIYGRIFPDENFRLKHSARGVLSMANAGPNTNGSQFFVLFRPAEWLDGQHVVFGKLIEGEQVLDLIETAGSGAGFPTKHVGIMDCGELTVQLPTQPKDQDKQ